MFLPPAQRHSLLLWLVAGAPLTTSFDLVYRNATEVGWMYLFNADVKNRWLQYDSTDPLFASSLDVEIKQKIYLYLIYLHVPLSKTLWMAPKNMSLEG